MLYHSEIDFRMHDFGARGVSSAESAAIGGAALEHLVNGGRNDRVRSR
jgi:nicotinic acid phosphoribosyltransferase